MKVWDRCAQGSPRLFNKVGDRPGDRPFYGDEGVNVEQSLIADKLSRVPAVIWSRNDASVGVCVCAGVCMRVRVGLQLCAVKYFGFVLTVWLALIKFIRSMGLCTDTLTVGLLDSRYMNLPHVFLDDWFGL